MDRKHSFAGSIVSSSLSFLLRLALHTPHSHLSYLVKLLYLGEKQKQITLWSIFQFRFIFFNPSFTNLTTLKKTKRNLLTGWQMAQISFISLRITHIFPVMSTRLLRLDGWRQDNMPLRKGQRVSWSHLCPTSLNIGNALLCWDFMNSLSHNKARSPLVTCTFSHPHWD